MPLIATMDVRPSAPPAAAEQRRSRLKTQANRFGLFAVSAFYILYFFRPEDFIPGLTAVPLEKITGGLAALALLGVVTAGRFRAGREVKLMLAYLFLLCCSIPGSVWPGGSFQQVEGIGKCLLVIIATICVVDSLAGLRRILLIPTLAMLFLAVLSFTHARQYGRMMGVGDMFSDPNYFAMFLCMVLPLCLYFMLVAKSKPRRVFWLASIALALAAIVATGSRGGFLALVAMAVGLLVSFRGKVRIAVIVLALGGIAALAALPNSYYAARLQTIMKPSTDPTGSAQIREVVLRKSVQVLLEHPLLGIGAGEFQIVSGSWHTTHNTYTELAAEAGIPALVLLLLLLAQWFKNGRQVAASERRKDLSLLAAAMQASLAAYLVGAFFLSTAYWPMPFLFVACSFILRQLSKTAREAKGPVVATC